MQMLIALDEDTDRSDDVRGHTMSTNAASTDNSSGALAGRVAVITGGASGIGRACANLFASEGASVVLGDLHLDKAVETAASIESNGGTAHAVLLDATDPTSCEELIQTAVDKYGRLDVVVAAAGKSHSGYVSGQSVEREAAGMLNQSLEDWQALLDVNLNGVMLTNQLAARVMIAAGNGGAIVNIASVAARIPLPNAVDYCVSKAGVEMLTKGFAMEMAPHNIRVNAIGPGFIETPMTARLQSDDEWSERMVAMTPLGRLGQAEEIANTALFLGSDQSSYFSGQTLFPAGGMFTG